MGIISSHVVIKNSGQTPAYDVLHWGEITVAKIVDENTLSSPFPLDKIGANSVPPQGIINKTRTKPAKLSDTELEGIKASTMAIYVYGRIEYLDAFERKRWTNYRLAYSGVWPQPSKNGVTLSFTAKGNETDETVK